MAGLPDVLGFFLWAGSGFVLSAFSFLKPADPFRREDRT